MRASRYRRDGSRHDRASYNHQTRSIPRSNSLNHNVPVPHPAPRAQRWRDGAERERRQINCRDRRVSASACARAGDPPQTGAGMSGRSAAAQRAISGRLRIGCGGARCRLFRSIACARQQPWQTGLPFLPCRAITHARRVMPARSRSSGLLHALALGRAGAPASVTHSRRGAADAGVDRQSKEQA